MGFSFNRLDERVFMAVPKPMQTEFGIHHRLESYAILVSECKQGSFPLTHQICVL